MSAPPTEPQILTSYLLHPAPLPTILPFSAFASLAPAAARSNPALHDLYLDLQLQRSIAIDDARLAIERECQRANALQAELARTIRRETGVSRPRKRKRSGSENNDNDNDRDSDGDDERERASSPDNESARGSSPADRLEAADVVLDAALSGPRGLALPPASRGANHDGASLLDALESASEDIAAEIASLEAEIAEVHGDVGETVSALSDLRYGKFASGPGGQSLEGEARKSLDRLVQVLKEV